MNESLLPAGWVQATIAELSLPISTRNPQASGEGEFAYIDIEAVDNELQRIERPRRLQNSAAPSRARNAVEAGDVIFSLVRPYLKNIAVVPTELQDAVASTAFFVCRPGSGVESRFLLNFLRQDSFIASVITYGNSPPSGHDDEFARLLVPVPPAKEQERIADALDELLSDLDAGVAALRRVLEKLKLYRVAVLKAAVDGALTAEWRKQHPQIEPASDLLKRILAERRRRWEAEQRRKFKEKGRAPPENWKAKYKEPVAPDTTGLPPLPEGWCWANTEQVSAFITKGTTPSGKDSPETTGEVPFVKVQHLSGTGAFWFFASPSFVSRKVHQGFLARSKAFPGDVLMNIVGPPLGQVSVVPTEFPEWNVNQAIAIFRPLPGLSNRFLANVLVAKPVLERALRRTKTTAGQVNLTLQVCRDLAIPLPPLAEQEAIVESVEGQLSIIDHLESDLDAKLTNAQALRQSILRHAFSGKLVAQDPQDEPASELLKHIAAQRARQVAVAKRLNGHKPRVARKPRGKGAPTITRETDNGRIADR